MDLKPSTASPFFPPNLTSIPKRSASRSKPTPEKSEKQDGRLKVWAIEDDQILLLEAKADDVKSGGDPKYNDFFKNTTLPFKSDYTFKQIKSKLRHFRDTYKKNEEEKKKGSELRFDTPHHKACHGWSKMIWGSGDEPEDGGVEGSETVGVEDPLEIPREKEKRKDGDAGETSERNTKKRKDGDAVAEIIKEVEAGETSEGNKKKMKAVAGDAEGVLENLIQRLTEAPSGFESFLNEKTKKALQSVEPSILVAFEENFKKLLSEEDAVYLKRVVLVREFASIVVEAVRSST